MSGATLTSKGQTTIPRDIRQFLKIDTGDRIEFIVKDNGDVVLKPALTEAKQLKGLLKSFAKKRAVSVEEMNRAIKIRLRKRQ